MAVGAGGGLGAGVGVGAEVGAGGVGSVVGTAGAVSVTDGPAVVRVRESAAGLTTAGRSGARPRARPDGDRVPRTARGAEPPGRPTRRTQG